MFWCVWNELSKGKEKKFDIFKFISLVHRIYIQRMDEIMTLRSTCMNDCRIWVSDVLNTKWFFLTLLSNILTSLDGSVFNNSNTEAIGKASKIGTLINYFGCCCSCIPMPVSTPWFVNPVTSLMVGNSLDRKV